jgi:hypothetical protein
MFWNRSLTCTLNPSSFRRQLLTKHPPLLFPQDRDAFSKITQAELRIRTTFENRFNDIEG